MEMIFHSRANKTHFYKKGCALGLILKVRVLGTRKWSILLDCGIQCNVVTSSCSNKPSSNVLLTESKLLKFTGLRDGITCVVYGRIASMVLTDLIINYKERLLQGKIVKRRTRNASD